MYIIGFLSFRVANQAGTGELGFGHLIKRFQCFWRSSMVYGADRDVELGEFF